MKLSRHWLLTLNDHRKEASSPGAWLATTVIVLLLVGMCSQAPGLSSWFLLPWRPALLCYLPCLAFGVTCSLLESTGRLSLRAFGVLQLAGSGLMQFFLASLISLSQPPGSFALASLFVLAVAYHGYILRAGPRYPYVFLVAVPALLGAYAVSPDSASASVLVFSGVTGGFMSSYLGAMGLREHAHRGEREKLRQAIYYRTLNESSREYERVSRKVVQLLGHNHDAGNFLSTVFLSAQLLEESLQQVPVPVPLQSQVQIHLARLTTQLDGLKGLIQRAQSLSEDSVELKVAPVGEVILEVMRDYRALFPNTSIELKTARDGVSKVRVHDGRLGLRRILDNVVQNACEGNGSVAATRIVVEVEPGDEVVRVSCKDDGPGFQAEQLATPPIPFRTTKADGHGLGLFNVSHLVQASGGRFAMKNDTERGAIVEIELVTA